MKVNRSTYPSAGAWSLTTTTESAHTNLSELVLAWGKDAETGQARYIFELDEQHRGAQSGCVCYSCGKPLTAVNAATTQWQIRPHFRHPDGAERNACLILSARAVALTLLQKNDRVVLPARRVDAQVVGVSGKHYNAWVAKPAESVSVKSFKTRDQVSAVLTLDDGREVLVRLTGSVSEGDVGEVLPAIEVLVDDPAIAALDPEALKERLYLLVEGGTWCGHHWEDSELRGKAQHQAESKALNALDWLPKEASPELEGYNSQESALHWLTKEILRQSGRLLVPDVVHCEFHSLEQGDREVARRPGGMLQLSDARLERRFGQIRPDVVAQYVDPVDGATGVLLLEVTVTNQITPERLARIQAEGKAALEINVGQLGGTLTLDDYTKLVTDELTAKRWLHHPWLVEIATQRQAEREAAERQFDSDLAELVKRYLAAARHLADLRTEDLQTPEASQARIDSMEEVRALGEELSYYGCKGADDSELYGWQGCILDRLLSIRYGKPVGYRVATLWEVIHTATIEKDPTKLAWHTLYLSALKAYAPELSPRHRALIATWRSQVLADLDRCRESGKKSVYHRDRKFDDLLGILFPEMRSYLKMPLPDEKNSRVASARPVVQAPIKPRNSGLWLTGEDLENWKRQNPEAARVWETFRRG